MIKEIGMRAGERLYEVLLTEEESRRACDLGAYYVIGGEGEPESAGSALPEGFVYASHTNTQWLSVERLADLLGESGDRVA